MKERERTRRAFDGRARKLTSFFCCSCRCGCLCCLQLRESVVIFWQSSNCFCCSCCLLLILSLLLPLVSLFLAVQCCPGCRSDSVGYLLKRSSPCRLFARQTVKFFFPNTFDVSGKEAFSLIASLDPSVSTARATTITSSPTDSSSFVLLPFPAL